MLLGLDDIERARARIGGRVHATPVMSSATVGDELGVLVSKGGTVPEDGLVQAPRGIQQAVVDGPSRPVARAGVPVGGNHAAALAYGAAAVGAKATIVIAAAARPTKGGASQACLGGV